MRKHEEFQRVVTRLLALSLLAAIPVAAYAQSIPLEIEVGTLYEGDLSGSIVHTARVSSPGVWALFIFGGDEPIALSAVLPDGSVIDHQFSDSTGNFLFLDLDRAGTIDLEFDVDLDPRAPRLSYAFVLAPVVDLAIDEWGFFDLRRAPIWRDPNEELGLGVFRVRPSEDVLLTLEIERERYSLDIRSGGPEAPLSVYDPYASDPSKESAVLQQPVLGGTDFGSIVLREPIDGFTEVPIELSISTDELVPSEPRALHFNEYAPGRLDAASPFESGRKVTPYYYEGTAGEQIAIVLESADFDTVVLVRTPAGELLEDDDGGSGTNSRLRVPDAVPGTYRIYARALDSRVTGPFRIAVSEYVAGPSAESTRGTRLENGREHAGRITGSSPSYQSNLVEVYEMRLSSRSSVNIQLRSGEFDSYLFVVTPDGYVVEDDDGMEFTNSRVLLDDVEAGLYRIYVSSYGGQEEGEFQVRYDLQ